MYQQKQQDFLSSTKNQDCVFKDLLSLCWSDPLRLPAAAGFGGPGGGFGGPGGGFGDGSGNTYKYLFVLVK